MRKMADCVGRGEVRIQIWGLFPLYHQARERLRTNPAPILVSRIYVCWWPTPLPVKADSFVEMGVHRDLLSRVRWMTGSRMQGKKGWTWCWVTVNALNPEQSWTSSSWKFSEHLIRVSVFGACDEGPYVGWLWISVFYIDNAVSIVLQNCDSLWKLMKVQTCI